MKSDLFLQPVLTIAVNISFQTYRTIYSNLRIYNYVSFFICTHKIYTMALNEISIIYTQNDDLSNTVTIIKQTFN